MSKKSRTGSGVVMGGVSAGHCKSWSDTSFHPCALNAGSTAARAGVMVHLARTMVTEGELRGASIEKASSSDGGWLSGCVLSAQTIS